MRKKSLPFLEIPSLERDKAMKLSTWFPSIEQIEIQTHCDVVYGDADARLRKAIYPWAGKTEKEKGQNSESDALTDHMEAALAPVTFLKPQQASSAETGHLKWRPGQENPTKGGALVK